MQFAEEFAKAYFKTKGVKKGQLYDFQLRALKSIAEDKPTLILAPPGAGKSLILYTAVSYYHEKYGLKTVYTVPTNSLLESHYNNYIKTLQQYYTDNNIPATPQEKVGYVRLLTKFELEKKILFMNTLTEYSLITGEFGEELISNITGKKPTEYEKRLFIGQIGWHALIQDETHFYTSNYNKFIEIINFISQYSKYYPTIISTATLPYTITKFLEEHGFNPVIYTPEQNSQPRFNNIETIPYSCTNQKIDLTNKIIEKIYNLNPDKHNKAIIFTNNTTTAFKTYNKLISEEQYNPEEILLLTSKIPPILRNKFDKDLNTENSKTRIIISTQVAEIGIDNKNIKYVITELSPLDSLIQRLGRVRPQRKTGDGEAIILTPLDCKKQQYHPYTQDTINRTLTIVNTELTNPQKTEELMRNTLKLSKQLDKIYEEATPKEKQTRKIPALTIDGVRLGELLYTIIENNLINSIIDEDTPPNTNNLTQLLKQYLIVKERTIHTIKKNVLTIEGINNKQKPLMILLNTTKSYLLKVHDYDYDEFRDELEPELLTALKKIIQHSSLPVIIEIIRKSCFTTNVSTRAKECMEQEKEYIKALQTLFTTHSPFSTIP